MQRADEELTQVADEAGQNGTAAKEPKQYGYACEGVGVSDMPEWFECPEKHTYWAFFVSADEKRKWWQLSRRKPHDFRLIYISKEQAEAAAMRYSTWDQQPARPIAFTEAMRNARRQRAEYLAVEEWVCGAWKITKKWKCSEPCD